MLVVSACATPVQRNDWSNYTGPGAELFRQEEYHFPRAADPIEPTNRIVWAINGAILLNVVAPISRGWRFLVPEPVRRSLIRAGRNLAYPVRLVNHLLQGQFDKAGDESLRFVANTTVGVLGLFDPAAKWGIAPAPAGLGQTLTKWGWKNSGFVVLPMIGPSTVRDTVGFIGDLPLDPTTYFFPAGPIRGFIEVAEHTERFRLLLGSVFDPYALAHLGWQASRGDVGNSDGQPAREAAVSPAAQTLASLSLDCRDPNFPFQGRTRRVKLPSTGRKLIYNVWMQPEPAPLVYVVPGLGAHRVSRTMLGVCEMIFRRGHSVAIISSSMHVDFMKAGATVPVPGFVPADARDVHAAIDAIDAVLSDKYRERITARALMGLSLGGLQTFFIAATAGAPENPLLQFDRYVVVNPPVNLRHGIDRLDAYYNTPLGFPAETRDRRVAQILRKAADADLLAEPSSDGVRTLTEPEAEFLIGLGFRLMLHDVIWFSQKHHDMGVLKTPLSSLRRTAAFDEIFDFSFMEYFYAFVLPYFTAQSSEFSSAAEMFELMDLRSLADSLPKDGSVRVFTNAQDFLLPPDDLQTLKDLLGEENVNCAPTGGHLGILLEPATQSHLMDSLEDLLPTPFASTE